MRQLPFGVLAALMSLSSVAAGPVVELREPPAHRRLQPRSHYPRPGTSKYPASYGSKGAITRNFEAKARGFG